MYNISLVPGLFFRYKMNWQMRKKYGLVSTAVVTVCMRETICVLIRIKLNKQY